MMSFVILLFVLVPFGLAMYLMFLVARTFLRWIVR